MISFRPVPLAPSSRLSLATSIIRIVNDEQSVLIAGPKFWNSISASVIETILIYYKIEELTHTACIHNSNSHSIIQKDIYIWKLVFKSMFCHSSNRPTLGAGSVRHHKNLNKISGDVISIGSIVLMSLYISFVTSAQDLPGFHLASPPRLVRPLSFWIVA